MRIFRLFSLLLAAALPLTNTQPCVDPQLISYQRRPLPTINSVDIFDGNFVGNVTLCSAQLQQPTRLYWANLVNSTICRSLIGATGNQPWSFQQGPWVATPAGAPWTGQVSYKIPIDKLINDCQFVASVEGNQTVYRNTLTTETRETLWMRTSDGRSSSRRINVTEVTVTTFPVAVVFNRGVSALSNPLPVFDDFVYYSRDVTVNGGLSTQQGSKTATFTTNYPFAIANVSVDSTSSRIGPVAITSALQPSGCPNTGHCTQTMGAGFDLAVPIGGNFCELDITRDYIKYLVTLTCRPNANAACQTVHPSSMQAFVTMWLDSSNFCPIVQTNLVKAVLTVHDTSAMTTTPSSFVEGTQLWGKLALQASASAYRLMSQVTITGLTSEANGQKLDLMSKATFPAGSTAQTAAGVGTRTFSVVVNSSTVAIDMTNDGPQTVMFHVTAAIVYTQAVTGVRRETVTMSVPAHRVSTQQVHPQDPKPGLPTPSSNRPATETYTQVTMCARSNCEQRCTGADCQPAASTCSGLSCNPNTLVAVICVAVAVIVVALVITRRRRPAQEHSSTPACDAAAVAVLSTTPCAMDPAPAPSGAIPAAPEAKDAVVVEAVQVVVDPSVNVDVVRVGDDPVMAMGALDGQE